MYNMVLVRHQYEREPHPVNVSVVLSMANDHLATEILRKAYSEGNALPDDWTLPDDLQFKDFDAAKDYMNHYGDVEVYDPTRFSVEEWYSRRDPELEHAQRVYDHDRDFYDYDEER